jgi:homoserine O-succinyltransferase
MPIKLPDNLPAMDILRNENIFVMGESKAFKQDIRPLRIIILNLMPKKQETEIHLLRILGNTPLQVEIKLLRMDSHISKNTASEYLSAFYSVFDDVKHEKFDGMVITGAPVEQMAFEDVTYWDELVSIMDWTKTNVTSTFHICWGAQAGLFHHYGIKKYDLPKKKFGVFRHMKNGSSNLLRGFDDIFYAPHSRYTEVRADEITAVDSLEILSSSNEAGVYIVASNDKKYVFVTGHSEYDNDTLKQEYQRDLEKGLGTELPVGYFVDDDPVKGVNMRWRAHATLLYTNWLNYFVYQETPYEL